MSAVFINPQLYVQKNDKFTTGIVYMPIILAYLISHFKNNNITTQLCDLFGSDPKTCRQENENLIFGKNIDEFDGDNFRKASCFFVYANQVANHLSVISIINYLKKKYKEIPVVVLENSQAVTAYSLSKIRNEFFVENCDYIVIGDLENVSLKFYQNLKNLQFLQNIKGLISKNFSNDKIDFVENLDELNFPAWEDFPLENYWDLGYAHGPLSSKRYLPILSSRGCPYPCNFCVIPKTNERRWRSRSAENVVEELKYWKKKFQINEFHFEDLNSTVNDKRTKELCRLIIKENLHIKWKIVAGTKVESIKDDETIKLLSKSGCKYISISPESGSKEVMKNIAKPFNYNHALKSVKKMNQEKIFTQACFIVGYPGETNDDLSKTKKMVFDLTRRGIDEIAVFIITPIPGSSIFESFEGFKSLTNLTFTPNWRKDYKKLAKERIIIYLIFLFTKIIFHPLKILRQVLNFFNRKFETKMEMVPYKFLKISIFQYAHKSKN
jgi:anaerobic magnesium-protoporphyrin IX monomethyl ester cyclase